MSENEIDDYIDQVAEQEATEILTRAGLTDSDANDFAWDVSRAVAPRAMANLLTRLADRGGETVSTDYLRSLAKHWADYEWDR